MESQTDPLQARNRKVLSYLNDDVNPCLVQRIKLTQYRYINNDSSRGFEKDHSIDGLSVETVRMKQEPINPTCLSPRLGT